MKIPVALNFGGVTPANLNIEYESMKIGAYREKSAQLES